MKISLKHIVLTSFISLVLPLYSFCQNNNFDWVQQIGGAQPQYAHAIISDDLNNTYTLGQFSGAAGIKLDSTLVPFVSNGNSDLFILKQDSEGKTIWIKHIGGKGNETPYSIALDKWGGLYLTGSFADTVDFNPSDNQSSNLVSVGPASGFVLKLDTAGGFQWAIKTSVDSISASSGVTSISVDDSGYLHTTGFFSASFKVSTNNTVLPSKGGTDVFVAKLDTAGSLKWAKSFGASAYDYGYTVQTDKSGNVYTVGMVIGEADFNPGDGVFMMQGGGGQYGGGGTFISKLDANGTFVWAKNLGNNTNGQGVFANYFKHLAIDLYDNIYVAGWFIGTVDFDPSTVDSFMVTTNGNYDAYVAKYDTAGNFKWVRTWGGTNADYGRGVTTDVIGNVYVGGQFRATVVFDSGTNFTLQSFNNTSDAFIVKFDSLASFIWAVKYGAGGDEYISSLNIDKKNSVYASGNFLSSLFGNTNFHTGKDTVIRISNGYDGYILKMVCIESQVEEVSISACDSYSYNNIVYTTSGNYFHQFWSQYGCDSSVLLSLTIDNIEEPVISVAEKVLSVSSSYATYQWLLDGALIENATQSTFHVIHNGRYQVVVSDGLHCVDTSDEYVVNNANSIENLNESNAFVAYPNPAEQTIQFTTINGFNDAIIKLIDVVGKTVLVVENVSGKAFQVDLQKIPSGMYIAEVHDLDKVYRQNIIKR